MRRTVLITALALVESVTLAGGASTWSALSEPAPRATAAPAVSTGPASPPAAAQHVPTPARSGPATPTRSTAPARRAAPVRTPEPAAHPATPRTRAPRLTPLERMRRAIARIPSYRPGLATWSMPAGQTHWGTANLGTGEIWVSPKVPAAYLYDVVVHEWSHVLSVAVYDGDVGTALTEMARVFGGGRQTGAERAADCMARAQGADWTHYTSCTDGTWRAAARRLLAGEPL